MKHAFPPGPVRTRNPLRRLRTIARFLRDPLGIVGERFATFGDLYHVDEGGGSHLFATCRPDAIRDVLVTKAPSFAKAGGANDRLRAVLGNGLLVADGEVWKRKRRLIQPGFRVEAIASYAETMVRHAASVDWADGAEIDLSHEMMALTLRIVCKALFDHDVAGQTDTVAAAMEALRASTQIELLPRWLPSPRRRRRRRAVAEIDALIEDLVARRRAEGLRTDLLSMLLAAGMEGRELRDELVTLFLAGHETTSHALTWTWSLLAEHPEALAALEQELSQHLGDRAPAREDLGSLPRLGWSIREGMRLYPPAFALPRVATERVEVDGQWLEPGWQIVCWVWHCHRDARWFEDPLAFRPERFASPAFPSHAYLPFGAGTRKCVGAGFAEMEMQLLLGALVQRYRLERRGPRPVPLPRVTLSPRGAVRMRVQRRRGPGPVQVRPRH